MASGAPPPYAPSDPSKDPGGYPPNAPYGPQNPGYPPPGAGCPPPGFIPPGGYPPPGAGYPPGGYPPGGYAPAPAGYPYQQPQPVMMHQPQQQQQQQSVIVIGGAPAGTGNCPVCRNGNLIEEFSCCGICLAIFFFPLGLICCLLMRDRRCNRCGARV